MHVLRIGFFVAAIGFARIHAFADGAADNLPDNVRRVPPPGIKIAAADRASLESELAALGKQIDALRAAVQSKPPLLELLPDVEIFHKAVRYALLHDEFFKTNEVEVARTLLLQGRDRANQLLVGKAPWTTNTGLVVRGYVSKIDGSVQPYGLVVPPSAQPNTPHKFRLDSWFHGRGEMLTELAFINERQRSSGEFTPPNTLVLHPYGRYCNANKFAGEVDLFEALAHVRKHYPIDESRLVMRGFSMGGAACWQFAVHHAGLWTAAAPGAGFSETADFLKVFQNEPVKPAWFEEKLWHLYDCTDYAVNLFNCPVVAYSGGDDKQIQAARMMEKALEAEGMSLVHVIGPKTGHKYHPDAKVEINRRIDSIAARGRDPVPRKVRFTTWTLRYNKMLWLTVDGMQQHWERARVDAEIVDDTIVRVTTKNVSALTLAMEPGLCPLDNTREPTVELDGQKLKAPRVASDRSWSAGFARDGRKWKLAAGSAEASLRKRHGLQGPIDDAFMDSFLMVMPSGAPMNDAVGKWVARESAHAIDHWRRQFRGEARQKPDSEVTDADIANHNLVLWGDPQSNAMLAQIVDKLPIRWSAAGIKVGRQEFPSAQHVPVMIYPNPLNPARYVVLNSGFTFREYDYLNNARQVPKLPDYAIVDISTPPSSRWPGKIAAADFFDEQWQLASGPWKAAQ